MSEAIPNNNSPEPEGKSEVTGEEADIIEKAGKTVEKFEEYMDKESGRGNKPEQEENETTEDNRVSESL